MLAVKNDGKKMRVETGTVVLEWDLARGGQICRCDFKSPHGPHALLAEGGVAPDLTLDLGDRRARLSDTPVKVSVERQDDSCLVFLTRGRVAEALSVEQRFEVYPEGGVFCEFGLTLDEGKEVALRNAWMQFRLDVLSARRMRGNYMSREAYLKQDVTCIHVLSKPRISMDRSEHVDIGHLLSLYGLDLGWDESRYFSNKFDMVIEDSTSIGDNMMGRTRTVTGEKDGKWSLTWQLCEDRREVLKAPFLYRNKWAVFCGAARTEAGAGVDPARRNNVLGARVCHVMYPYVREGADWPWASMPIRQTFYQDAQAATENPPLPRVDEAADLGANILILHQFWMNNSGSCGEPQADYIAADPAWLRAFIARAHERGMRVALYMRGIEQYCLYLKFFEQYLTRDLDGLYVDWAFPFSLGFQKSSSRHSSVHNWFLFSRALRKTVGEGGFLIGHTVMQNHVSYAMFDAVLTGELSVFHAGLLHSPEISASYAGLGSAGVHLIAGNSPDRAIFSSQRAAAFAAGLGYVNHPIMEPGMPFRNCCAYAQPIWDMLRALGSEPVRHHNPAVGTGDMLTWSHDALHPVIYQAANGTALVIVTNLSDEPVTGEVTVDLVALGLKGSSLRPLEVNGAHRADVDDNRIRVRPIPPYAFCGQLAVVRPLCAH